MWHESDAHASHSFSITKNVMEVKYTPSVIEPSFGIGRVLYGVLEHSYVIPRPPSHCQQPQCLTRPTPTLQV